MIRKFKKQLALLFTGSFTMVLAACYGVPVDIESDIMIKTVNEQNEAIEGLKVYMTNNGERIFEDYTDNNGNVYYPYLDDNEDNDYAVKIEDVDGEENGGQHYTKLVDIHNQRDEYIITMSKL
jgi:hypothetical protein